MGNTPPLAQINSGRSVHPHACGEHIACAYILGILFGSSPRLWGTLSNAPMCSWLLRFIPTPVGNTGVLNHIFPPTAVHPHACGEHSQVRQQRLKLTGSSPRLWGTPHAKALIWTIQRFIPTPVGNTRRGQFTLYRSSVHPHACGEHIANYTFIFYQCGSSPRLWGTLRIPEARSTSSRFIPTPVGNTGAALETQPECPVHPHACGEHVDVRAVDHLIGGSSPRLWGTRLKSLPRPDPHGSSPRLWGTRREKLNELLLARFIPTPVGNTKMSESKKRGGTVHPHACGEHIRLDTERRLRTGSSPRLWGTQL